MTKTIRLVLKLQRFEVIVLSIAALVLTAVTLVVTSQLSALPAQIAVCPDPSTCRSLEEQFAQLKLQAAPITLLNLVLPIFAGLILGVPIVAREIERGTAALPWSMSASRRRWFLWRFMILGCVVVVLSVLAAFGSELLASASYPGLDMARSFRDVETRGLILVGRALVAFSLASLAGAIMGRTLSGLLLAIALAAAALFGLELGQEAWLRADSVPMPEGVSLDDAVVREVGYLLPDGRVVDWDTAWTALSDPNSNPADSFPERYIGVQPDLAPEKRAREVTIAVLAGLLAGGFATLVVDRRRPY